MINRQGTKGETKMPDITDKEIDQIIDATGRRKVSNWDQMPAEEKLMINIAVREFAMEWLRARVREQREATAG